MIALWLALTLVLAAGAFWLGWYCRRQADKDTMAAAQTMLTVGRDEADIAKRVEASAESTDQLAHDFRDFAARFATVEQQVGQVFGALSQIIKIERGPAPGSRSRARTDGEDERKAPPLGIRRGEPSENMLR